MDARHAHGVLRHAVSLHVLTPDDLDQAGGVDDPVAALVELQRQRVIGADVVAALGQLVQAQRRRVGGPADAPTLSPERGAASGGTLALERGPGEQVVVATDRVEGETLAPEREAAGVRWAAGPTDEDDATVRLLRRRSEADGGDTLAGVEAEAGTLAGVEVEAGTLAGIEAEAETLAGIEAEVGTRTGEAEAQGLGASVSLDLTTGRLVPPRRGRAQPEAGAAIDLALVSERTRRRIHEAAFLRAAVAGGHLERGQAADAERAAEERDVLLEEHLVQEGLLTRAQVAAVQAAIHSAAAVCPACLAPVPAGAGSPATCGGCGAARSPDREESADTDTGTSAGTGTSTSAGTSAGTGTGSAGTRGATLSTSGGTLVSETSNRPHDARGIEGFPGEGGRFASYQLLSRVAEGGMGVVFKARELNLNRVVALKVMRGGALASKLRRRRFLTEAEAAAALHHPNIVPIHHISEVSGYPFYTMDFVEGRVLDDYVREQQVSQHEVAALVRTVADAVHHFHLRGIIHRDLKPDNVLVDEQGEPRIIDFGIAKKIAGSEFDTEAAYTVEGEVLGTPHYMPPEQASGRVHEVDTRSDVYALGAIMYELLTGKPPFYGLPTARVVLAIQDEDPRPVSAARPDADPDLVAIVEKAMAKERERRYQSALELEQDLGRYVRHEPILARPAGFGYRLAKLARRHRDAMLGGAVVAVALLTALGYGLWKAVEDQRRIADFIARAAATPDLEQRRALLDRALGLDPDHELARSEKVAVELELKREADLAEAQRQQDEALRLERERAKQHELEAQLAKTRAEQQVRQLEAAQLAREEAASAQRREREGRARALLERASQPDLERLQAISDLTDALALVPEDSGELGARLAVAKVGLAAALAEEALGQARAGMAEYWLDEANKLQAAAGEGPRLEAISRRIFALSSGNALYQEAKRAIAAADWLLARDKLRQARGRGLDTPELREDVLLVRARCEAFAGQVLSEARVALGEGQAERGVALANQAAAYLEGEDQAPARELAAEGARQAFQRTRVRVHTLWQRAETRAEALELLRVLGPVVAGTPFAALVDAERRQRQRLCDDPALAGLIYAPALPELGVEAAYVMRTEVTNEDYKRFVDAGGYRDLELWDAPARELVRTLRDHTPGQPQPGPRTWIQGGYGDPANATRPVRGVTFYEARAYARWLRRETGAAWRLPTRQEWEAFAGWDPVERRLLRYPWGDAFRPEVLEGLLAPAGSVEADRSPLGIRDLAGNVSEWVEERLDDGVRPALKGSFFGAGAAQAARLASVENTGHPGAAPPRELTVAIGFRLVLPAEAP